MIQTKLSSYTLQLFGGITLGCVLLIGMTSGLQERIFNLGSYLWPSYSELTRSTPEVADDACTSKTLTNKEDLLLLDDLLGSTQPESVSELTTDACSETLPQTHREQANTEETQAIEHGVIEYGLIAHSVKDIEQSIQSLNLWLTGQQSLILSIFILVSLISATQRKKHLSLAPDGQRSKTSLIAQILSNVLISYACYEYAMHLLDRNYLSDNAYAYLILALGFGLNLLLCIYYLPSRKSEEKRQSRARQLGHTLKSIPIYSWMILLSVLLDKESTQHELALLIGQIYEMPLIYLQIGLYIWLGMLIKHSKLAEIAITLVMSLIRNPIAVACSLVALMAIPTAFTGASGIIILAMGGVVYQSLKKLPLRRQFILAITAMTGSTGVVLSPSLLIVAIAFLNKDVTTNELFYWGSWVFFLTLGLVIVITRLLPNPTIHRTSTDLNAPNTIDAIKACIPYLLVSGLIIVALDVLMGLSFNEFTAPYFLLLLMLGILFMEVTRDQKHTEHKPTKRLQATLNKGGIAIKESFEHSGAILLVMLCSYSLGNTSFDPGWLSELPINNLSMVSTLCALVVLLIVIGMILDPFGALILVSMTLAPFAYEQGLHPIHFWMITLVAFELAYVTPPVAMNHLLTRQQVPEHEWLETDPNHQTETTSGIKRLYLKHERVILPILVLGTSLVIVTFVPLLFVS